MQLSWKKHGQVNAGKLEHLNGLQGQHFSSTGTAVPVKCKCRNKNVGNVP